MGDKCPHCGNKSEKIRISPPGDVRPAFKGDYSILKESMGRIVKLDDRFFESPILLNHVSYIDRMDEIIMDSYIIGSLRFVPNKQEFEFVFSAEGAKLVFSYIAYEERDFRRVIKRFKHIVVDKIAGEKISQGYNVLAPGVISFSEFEVGDEVFVFSEEGCLVGVGRTRVNSQELNKMSRGIVAKNRIKKLRLSIDETSIIYREFKRLRKNLKSLCEKAHLKDDLSSLYLKEYDPFRLFPDNIRKAWRVITYYNKPHLLDIEKEAINFIKTTIKDDSSPITVSFSGGKDSIVILEITRRACEKWIIFFIDTGIEFPETSIYARCILKHIAKLYGDRIKRNLIKEYEVWLANHIAYIRVPDKRFWRGIESLGLPAMDWRWCCKTNKLAPARQLIRLIEPGQFCVVGVRRYESFSRAREGRISYNPWTDQTNIYPIYNWNALEVWLYILLKRLPINPLYGEGFMRIGCWLCPANHLSDLMLLKRMHPDLHTKLEKYIEWALDVFGIRGEGRVLVKKLGLWRWMRAPKKIIERGIKFRPIKKVVEIIDVPDENRSIIKINNWDESLKELIKTLLKAFSDDFEILESKNK